MLVRADLLVPQPTHFLSNIPFGKFKCGCCQQCNFTYKTQTINHPFLVKLLRSGERFLVKQPMSCICCIVLVDWATWGKQVDNSKLVLLNVDVQLGIRTVEVQKHNFFFKFKHSISTLQYIGIEAVKLPRRGGDINNLLLKREAYWIYTMNTLSSNGLL